MKRIVNGVTYNTTTSTCIGISRYEDEAANTKTTETLHQTRGGAFFIHEAVDTKGWNENEREYFYDNKHNFRPLSPEDAHKWYMSGEVEIVDESVFQTPPEATAEAEPGATLYVRVPASLKRRIDDAAKAGGMSGNNWAMRCVESCLAEPKEPTILDYKPLVYIWEVAATIDTIPDGEWTADRLREAIHEILQQTQAVAEILKVSFDELSGTYVDFHHDHLKEKFKPFS